MSDKPAESGSVDSDKPVAPAKPVAPVAADEATVTAPVGASPADPTEPAESAESAESADPTEPAKSAELAEPVESAEPAESAELESVAAGGGGTDKPEVAQSRPSAARNPLLVSLVVAVLLLIGAVGIAGYLFVQERNIAQTLAAQDEARQAACRYAPVLADYDAKNLDPYFSAVLAGATGDWKKEFETTTSELREALVAGQVVSRAGEIQCAVKSADETSAEVVVVIGQTISSLGTQGQPAPGQLSMVMRMEKADDGRWLVNQMITPLAPGARQ